MEKHHTSHRIQLQYSIASCALILTLIFGGLLCDGRSDETASEFQQGVEYVTLRQYSHAADIFKTILARNPTDVNALFQLGSVYRLRDELALAVETFDKILTLPAPEKVYGITNLSLSEIYCKQSKLDMAEAYAKRAVQQCPHMADTHYRLGYVYTHQAKFDAALAAFKRALTRNPDFAEIYEWLGLIALMQHKPNEAVTYYKTAIRKKPYVQSAYYNLAKAYRMLGDTESAQAQLKLFQQMKTYYDKTYAIESALAEKPTNAPLRMELAQLHVAHKHISAAIATYQALLRLNPEFIAGYDKLGRLYMTHNMPEHAIPLFQKVLQLNPNAVEAHVRLGWLYMTQKTFDKAESHLQKAIERMPKLTLAYHGLAEIYTQQGHTEKAVDIYQHIIQIEPDDTEALTALRALKRLKKVGETKQ